MLGKLNNDSKSIVVGFADLSLLGQFDGESEVAAIGSAALSPVGLLEDDMYMGSDGAGRVGSPEGLVFGLPAGMKGFTMGSCSSER